MEDKVYQYKIREGKSVSGLNMQVERFLKMKKLDQVNTRNHGGYYMIHGEKNNDFLMKVIGGSISVDVRVTPNPAASAVAVEITGPNWLPRILYGTAGTILAPISLINHAFNVHDQMEILDETKSIIDMYLN